MIDIHCHILPAIDDGPHDMTETLEMCRLSLEDGVTGVFATPHLFHGMFHTDSDSIAAAHHQVTSTLTAEGIPLKLYLGSDLHLTPHIGDSLKSGEALTLNGGRYFLLEPSFRLLPPNLTETVFALISEGFVPIITHPERNEQFLRKEERLLELLGLGALCQITAMSVTGELGEACRRFSQSLLEAGAVHFIASDAHSAGWRRPGISAAREVAEGLMGAEEARKLVLDHPQAVIDDLPIETVEVTRLPRRRKFWFF